MQPTFWGLTSLLLLLCLSAKGYGAVVTLGKEDLNEIKLDESMELAIDTRSWDEATSPPESGWRPSGQGPRGVSSSVYWARVQLINLSEAPLALVLASRSIHYPVKIWPDGADRPELYQQTGFYSENVTVAPGTSTLYLKFQRIFATNEAQFTLFKPENFSNRQRPALLIKGLTLGAAFAMLIFHLFMYTQTRQRQFAFYGGYLFFFLLSFVIASGMIQQLHPNTYLLKYRSYWNGLTHEFSMIFACLFTLSFLNLKTHMPRLHRFLSFYIYFGLANACLILVDVALAQEIRSVVTLLCAPLMLYSGFYVTWLGYRPAYWYSLGWIVLTVGALVHALFQLGLTQASFWVIWAIWLGGLGEMIIFAVGLTDKFQIEQKQARDKIDHLNLSLTETNRVLERSFKELEHEERSRLRIARDLAHRGNNPIHVARLTLSEIGKERRMLSDLVMQLFGNAPDQNDDAKLCLQEVKNHIQCMEKHEFAVQKALDKTVSTISEIRLLSGVDGYSSGYYSLADGLQDAYERLREALGPIINKRLSISFEAKEKQSMLGNSLVVSLAIGRILQFLLENQPEPVVCKVGRVLYQEESRSFSFSLQFPEVGKTLFFEEAGLQLLEDVLFTLKPFHHDLKLDEHDLKITVVTHIENDELLNLGESA